MHTGLLHSWSHQATVMAGRITVVQGYSVNWVQVMWRRWAILPPTLEFCVCVRQAILETFGVLCIFLDCWFPHDPIYTHDICHSFTPSSFLSFSAPSLLPLFASWHWLLCYLYLFLAHILFQLPTTSIFDKFWMVFISGFCNRFQFWKFWPVFFRQSSSIFHWLSYFTFKLWHLSNISFWVLTRRLKFDSFPSYFGNCWKNLWGGVVGAGTLVIRKEFPKTMILPSKGCILWRFYSIPDKKSLLDKSFYFWIFQIFNRYSTGT